ncbi:MAG: AraC family transcriptional regulator, partial [bacterium]
TTNKERHGHYFYLASSFQGVERKIMIPKKIFPDTFYYLGLHVKIISETKGEIDFWVNEELVVERSLAYFNIRDSTDNRIEIGNRRAVSNIFGNITVDNVIVSDRYMPFLPPGPQKTESKNMKLKWKYKDGEMDDISACRWQISYTNSFIAPVFNSGTDSINRFIMNIPKSLDINKPLFWRVCCEHGKKGWSRWSDINKVLVTIADTAFHEMKYASLFWKFENKKLKKPFIKRNKWHKAVIDIAPESSVKDISFIDFWCTPSIYQKESFATRKTSKFDPRSFYWASLSMGSQSLWTKPDPGIGRSQAVTGQNTPYLDDSTASYFAHNDKGRFILNFRLLDQAEPGPWCAGIQAKLIDGTLLPQLNFPFFVVKEDFKAEDNIRCLKYILILSIILLIVICRGIYKKKKADEIISKAVTNPLFERAMEKINQDISAQIKVEDLARHLNITRKSCFALFKKHTGTSVIKYVLDIRMKKAKELLESTYLSISEVQYKVGFNDSSYFSRSFKKWFGTTPTAIRQKKNTKPFKA